MTGRMQGKVAVITGGASGMGRATALSFLDHGARVLIADINAAMGEETIALAQARGFADKIVFVRCDVSVEADVEAMIGEAVGRFDGLDCLYNNAGVGGALTPILDTTIEDWERTQALLLRSVFLGLKHGGRTMRKLGRGGSIINTASTAGVSGGCGPAAYSAAKTGVVSLTKSAAVELAGDRIRVNAIAPGGIRTPLLPVTSDEELLGFMKGHQPWPDAGQPEHIAAAALYLASDESRFCTGTTMVVDGGLLAWGPALFPHAAMSA